MIYLDTHVVIWIYQKNTGRFNPEGLNWLEQEDILISPIVELEMEYLFEIDKIRERSAVILNYLEKRIGLAMCEESFPRVIKKASSMKWTRDPFDRIITAQAALQDAPLLTQDRQIQKHYPKAVW